MKKNIYCFFLALFFICQSGISQVKKKINIKSPDKTTIFETGIDKKGNLQYRMSFNGKSIIDWSLLGIGTVEDKIRIENISKQTKAEKFLWIFGERDSIENNYNEVTLACASSTLKYNVVARVYNGSIAFRYLSAKGDSSIRKLKKELTAFNLTTTYTMYQYNQESVFTPVSIDSFNKSCDFPATLTDGKWFVHIGEAANNQFTKAELKRGTTPHSLVVAYVRDSVVNTDGEELTAWRTISVSKTAIGLHAFSDLNYRLNPAPEKPVAETIKPGKLIRSQLNTQSGLDCIDFAAKHSMQYIMFDAGWYGAEFRSSSDPTQVIAALDLPKVIAHGKEKGIGVILYVNYVGLRTKLDTILPLYKQWGVAGMKFGFVDGLTQRGITWLNNAIKKVNEYGFVLDIHDNYKPTGLSRTYPALFTQEGIRGDENSPDAFHTTTLPFTRFLAGPADFTFCYPNSKDAFSKNLKVTKAHQLALSVIYYSPLQSLYWYGRPLDYTKDFEIEFFDYVPTVWNESYYLSGEIGKNITVARRNGGIWYMGSVAGMGDWHNEVSLNFLKPGVQYEASIYEDDGKGSIHKTILNVKKGDLFPLKINAGSGQAVIIREVNK
jgi:alpha-glucosidase